MSKIEHPSHYSQPGRKECIEEMLENYGGAVTGIFCLTNAYKYLYRAGNKINESSEDDVNKAKWYLNYFTSHNLMRNITFQENEMKLYNDLKALMEEKEKM